MVGTFSVVLVFKRQLSLPFFPSAHNIFQTVFRGTASSIEENYLGFIDRIIVADPGNPKLTL